MDVSHRPPVPACLAALEKNQSAAASLPRKRASKSSVCFTLFVF
jgi:hypothetical protein